MNYEFGAKLYVSGQTRDHYEFRITNDEFGAELCGGGRTGEIHNLNLVLSRAMAD